MPATHDDLAAVLAHAESRRDADLEDLFRLIRQPSISAQNVGIPECAAIEAELLRDAGLETRAAGDERAPDGLRGMARRARQADRALLRPLRRPAARPAGAVEERAVRAGDPRRTHLRARRGGQQGAALQPYRGDPWPG